METTLEKLVPEQKMAMNNFEKGEHSHFAHFTPENILLLNKFQPVVHLGKGFQTPLKEPPAPQRKLGSHLRSPKAAHT